MRCLCVVVLLGSAVADDFRKHLARLRQRATDAKHEPRQPPPQQLRRVAKKPSAASPARVKAHSSTASPRGEIHDCWAQRERDAYPPSSEALRSCCLMSDADRLRTNEELSLIHISEPTRPY